MGRSRPAPAGPRGRNEPAARLGFHPLLAFLALSFLLYGNTLLNGFVHDDKPLVGENHLIRGPLDPVKIFSSGYWTTRDRSVPELYRPLTILSLALNHLVGGDRPVGFHLVNLLLNGVVCWLVFSLARALGASRGVAWAAGLLFAVHPVHVEAVAPAVGRSELLAAGFALLALLAHRRAREGAPGSARFFGLAALSYLAAAFSKEGAIVVPALALLTDLALPAGPKRSDTRDALLPYALYAAAAGLYLLVRMAVLGAVARSMIHPLDNPLVGMDRISALRTALVVAGKYLLLMVWPFRLSADYSGTQIAPALSWADPRIFLSVAALAFLAGLALVRWRRGRLGPYGVLFYFAAWLPISNLFFFIGVPLAERLLYLPSVGLCLAAGAVWEQARLRSRIPALTVLSFLLLAGSARTFARNRIWHDDGSFAFATAANAPTSAKAQFNWGVFLEEHSDLQGAASAYSRATQLAPDWADTHFNLAGALARSSRLPQAVESYRRALALRPEDPRIVLNLGFALYQAKRNQEAVELYQEFLRRQGESAAVLNGLAANLVALGRAGEALEAYGKAVALAPEELGYRLNLAQALEAAGDPARADVEYRNVLRRDPENGPALRNLGMLLYGQGKSTEAMTLLQKAAARLPGGLDGEAAGALRALQESNSQRTP